MNGDWYPWCVGVPGNTSAQYVAMWRHVHAIFVQQGATNVRWVWSPNVTYYGAQDFTAQYPGDAYVDWVALDGYNFGTSQSWSWWVDFTTIFGPSYDALVKITNKPVMIAEFASVEQGGDKAMWITSSMLSDIPVRFPKVRAALWFNEDRTQFGQADWRINTSSQSLSAFVSVMRSNLYQGRLS
jgi:beta-mannanase